MADRAFSAFGVVLATHHIHAVGQGEVLGEPTKEREAHPHRQEDVDHVFVEEDIADVRDALERFDHGMHHDRNQGDSATRKTSGFSTLNSCFTFAFAPISPAIAWAMLSSRSVWNVTRGQNLLAYGQGGLESRFRPSKTNSGWNHVIHGTSWSIDTCCRNCCKSCGRSWGDSPPQSSP